MNSSAQSATRPPVVILSLDGGGARGLSSLLILEHILSSIGDCMNLVEQPRPCEIFDLIGGTGTGGIIAIMLGRLGMTISQSIDAYKSLVGHAFVSKQEKHPTPSTGFLLVDKLDISQDGEKLFRHEYCTKTAILALTKVNMETLPTLFTTYGISRNFAQCTVSEVAKAASAANNLSGSIKTGEDKEVFIDAQYGYNNPCEVLISETKRQFPGRELIILSIGTGVNDVVEIKDTDESLNLAFSRIATTSKQSDLRLQNIYGGSGVYHRFDVENGLRDPKSQGCQSVGSIAAHTRNYVQENESSIMEFVEAFTGARSSLLVQPEKEYERSPGSADSGKKPRPRSLNQGKTQQKPPRTNWVNSGMSKKESRLKSWWSNTTGSKAHVKRMMNFLSTRKR